MAFTVVSTPDGVRPVGTGKLEYVFHSTSIPAGYHIEIELNGLTMPVQSYYPDADGDITCDIATLLRFWISMSPTVANRFKNTYVKYQEVWDAGSNAQVPLSSDVIYFYIGSNNYLNNRTSYTMGAAGGVYLIDSYLRVWAGRTSYIEFISDGTLTARTGLYFVDSDGVQRALSLFSGTSLELKSIPLLFTESGTVELKALTWTAQVEAEANNWTSVAVSDVEFVPGSGLPRIMAVSNNGTHRVMHSDDGATWVIESAAAANPWNDIAWGGGNFVAVAPTGTDRVMWSNFGLLESWVSAAASEANAWQSIAFSPTLSRFASVSNNGTHRCMTSDDGGQTWTNRTIQSEAWTKIRWVNDRFISISNSSAKMSYSIDGITWSTVVTTPKALTGISYGNGIYIGVGSGASPEGVISTDGIIFTALDLPLSSAPWSDIAFGEGVFSLITVDGNIRQTVDGVNFISNTAPSANSWNALTYVNSQIVAYGTGGFVAVGDSGGISNGVMTGVSFTVPNSEIQIDLVDECRNPIYLKWLNDYGGLSTWLFDQDQIFRIDPQDDGRYPEKTVFARNLTIEEWKALQELNRTGAEYGDNQKQGVYLVDFTDESNAVNVFTLPEPKDTQTKFSKNEFQLQLRYPIAENIVI